MRSPQPSISQDSGFPCAFYEDLFLLLMPLPQTIPLTLLQPRQSSNGIRITRYPQRRLHHGRKKGRVINRHTLQQLPLNLRLIPKLRVRPSKAPVATRPIHRRRQHPEILRTPEPQRAGIVAAWAGMEVRREALFELARDVGVVDEERVGRRLRELGRVRGVGRGALGVDDALHAGDDALAGLRGDGPDVEF